MFRIQCVLGLVVLYVALVHSWDIVVARSNRLEFYNEGILELLATPASNLIKWITYDPVHDRVLFAEKYNRKDSVSSFNIANQTTQSLIKRKTNRYITKFDYDPATELLFGTVAKSIYSFPLGSGNNEVNGSLLITLETIPREVTLDSCEGYIYWISNNIIERALFNGSKRDVIIDNTGNVTLRQGLTVDTQKIYWIETQEYKDGAFSIESADLDGNNRTTLYSKEQSDSSPDKLTVSKDFIFWGDSIEKFFWEFPKHPLNTTDVKPNKIALDTTKFSGGSHDIAANSNIEERTRDVPNCNALKSLLPDYQFCFNSSVFCVHGTIVVGASRCDCTQGYIGLRCDVPVCENYCSQGDCSVNANGQPQCRCNAGYTGVRCDTSVCENYCLQGYCSVCDKGQPQCRCNTGYTGDRCDTSVCKNYCLEGNCSVCPKGQPKCRCNAGYTGDRCNVSICESYCSEGDCIFSTNGRPKCRCNAGYTGHRCDTSVCENYCLQGNCNVSDEGQPKCRCNAGYSGKRCDVNPCHNYCLNYGVCSLNAKDQPVCQCREHFTGRRCEFRKSDGFHWVPMVDGRVPPDAVIGGYERGKEIYVGRAYYMGSLCPGKYVKELKTFYLSWGGEEHTQGQFEILCGSKAKWFKTEYDNIPKNAIIGGRTGGPAEVDGEPLYICRDWIENTQDIVCGKAYARYKTCYLPYSGREVAKTSYEILVAE